jgi:hypothetical protein
MREWLGFQEVSKVRKCGKKWTVILSNLVVAIQEWTQTKTIYTNTRHFQKPRIRIDTEGEGNKTSTSIGLPRWMIRRFHGWLHGKSLHSLNKQSPKFYSFRTFNLICTRTISLGRRDGAGRGAFIDLRRVQLSKTMSRRGEWHPWTVLPDFFHLRT